MTIFQLCPSTFFLMMVSNSKYATTRTLIYLLDLQNGAFGFGSIGNLLNSTVQQIDCELTTFTLSGADRSFPRMCSGESAA